MTERGVPVVVRFRERSFSDIVEPDLFTSEAIQRFAFYLWSDLPADALVLRISSSARSLDPALPIGEQIDPHAELELAARQATPGHA